MYLWNDLKHLYDNYVSQDYNASPNSEDDGKQCNRPFIVRGNHGHFNDVFFFIAYPYMEGYDWLSFSDENGNVSFCKYTINWETDMFPIIDGWIPVEEAPCWMVQFLNLHYINLL